MIPIGQPITRLSAFVSAEFEPDFKSKAIMKEINAPYSHAGFIFNNTVQHATGEGVHETPLDHFLKTHYLPHEIDLLPYVLDPIRFLGWCEGNHGKDYSETGLVGLKFKPLRVWLADGESEVYCSEYTARGIDKWTSIPVFDLIDKDWIDPKVFIEPMLKYTNQKVVENG